MKDEPRHKRKRAFAELPGNKAEWRKTFISGIFQASVARYMDPVCIKVGVYISQNSNISEPASSA